jgi:hypothetical protein
VGAPRPGVPTHASDRIGVAEVGRSVSAAQREVSTIASLDAGDDGEVETDPCFP